MDTNLYEQRTKILNYLVNTFTKGMNTDTSDMYMPSEQYRYSENLRITADENGDSGELHLIEGTQKIELNLDGNVLDVNYIKNICTIILEKNGKWCIKVYNYDTNTLYKITDEFSEPIWEGDELPIKKKTLSTTIVWEADDNIKFYIADGIHLLMSLKLQKNHEGIFKKIEGTYEQLFGRQSMLLPPPDVEISQQQGNIEGATVQYAYIAYERYGTSTTLSVLSKRLSLYKDSTSGFYNENTTCAVNITIPLISSTYYNYIRIYRIAYVDSGQQPKISVIADRKLGGSNVFVDTGYVISSESVSEFLANINLGIQPKLIELKNNYLFAANVKYTQDEVDKLFELFDSRCFSRGDYLKRELNEILFDGTNLNDFISETNESNIYNKLFDHYPVYEWNKEYWNTIDGFNGIGKYFKWKYVVNEINITPSELAGSIEDSNNSYLRNEVYRFGVKLYDLKGRASSVKWIADIKMPDFYNIPDSSEQLRNPFDLFDFDREDGLIKTYKIKIEFVPNNTSDSIWNNISAYEIVQSPRTRDDIYGLTLGIGGLPMKINDSYISLPYYLTTDNFHVINSGMENLPGVSDTAVGINYKLRGINYEQNPSYLLFSSPESAYNQEDTYSIIKDGAWNIKKIFSFEYPYNKHDVINVEDGVALFWYELSPWEIKRFADAYKPVDNPNPDHIVPEELPNPDTQNDIKVISDTKINKFRIGVIKERSDDYSLVNEASVGGYYIDTSAMQYGNKHDAEKKNSDDWAGYYYSMSYLSPNKITTAVDKSKYSIEDEQKIESQISDNFANENAVTARGKGSSVIGGVTYVNWTNPLFASLDITGEPDRYLRDADGDVNTIVWNWCKDGGRKDSGRFFRVPISAGGRYLLLKLNYLLHINRDKFEDLSNVSMPSTPVFQIYKTNTIPYTGRSESSILNSTYIPIGAFATTGNSCIANGGDGYIKYFTFNHLSTQYNAIRPQTFSLRVLYRVPLESRIDIQGQASPYLYNDDYRVRDLAGTTNEFAQDRSLYIYNNAYNVTPDVVTYNADSELEKETQYTTRVHYSQPKTNNEIIDSWNKFKTVDFIDVDTRYGDITGLKLFMDKLVFMQDSAAGVLSVNDRTIINDSNNNSIILGNSGVLLRYDYITTLYGMKPDQKAYATSNDALYWWDGHNKEIIQYKEGYSINLLQHQKYIDSYITKRDETETPSIFYDKRNKEAVFSIVKGGSVVYNEKIEQFTSVYTFNPIYYCGLIDCLILVKDNEFYKYNISDDGETSTLFENAAKPSIQYVVNSNSIYNKVFDIQTFGGKFYGGSDVLEQNNSETHQLKGEHNNYPLLYLNFIYKTPLKLESRANGKDIVTNVEYDFRLTIPRAGYEETITETYEEDGIPVTEQYKVWRTKEYGDRMRGKTMQCELKSSSNNLDFSLQYIITKFRTSWA